ncbi:hypothetical protein [Mycobacterium asiaticum]|uniref:GCM domain-containing protein n=1 Tax=Mycobacterium asiaticum TaxID=1790 RepID=A0A1A3NMG8_MYCAS|nr:hypothetical protein [Mycobacterium asiaticum]OBK22545.1 hypothetical protein A5635_21760 [Mycobacterium asiaticum]
MTVRFTENKHHHDEPRPSVAQIMNHARRFVDSPGHPLAMSIGQFCDLSERAQRPPRHSRTETQHWSLS